MAKSFLKKRRNDLIYIVIRALLLFLKILPRSPGLALFGCVGRLFFNVPTVERRRTFLHLQKIFSSSWSTETIEKTAKAVYYNLGKNLYDSLYLTSCNNRRFFSIVKTNDQNPILESYHRGDGVIALTGHLGCFEMTVHALARQGIQCVTIGQQLYDKRVDTLINTFRTKNNITYLHRDGSGREIIRLLKRGYLFGALVDQDTNIEGVFTDFLGHPAYTPSSPIRIAMRFTIPLYVAITKRNPDESHDFILHGPLEMDDTGDFTRDLVINTQKVSDLLSEGIINTPEQWVWMHRRWRRSPDDPSNKSIPSIYSYR